MINKELISATLGCIILIFHVALSFFLWTRFAASASDDVAIAEISLPITVTYTITVVKWLIDNQGKLSRRRKVGWSYVIGLSIVSFGFLGMLAYGPFAYLSGDMTSNQVNQFFAFAEASIGCLMVLFFNDLFGGKVTNSTG